ncbi:carboxy-terminal kinesin 2-like [Hypanus sabinus]|uniref:carboxy-terminal kinesin 2-like n=1 Tax=Hypanus sabinus TaxID=79690 RepID=UPI0028C3D6EC|nr:carboxy-terminal kinesin 2-like [Hypanus sabinus]
MGSLPGQFGKEVTHHQVGNRCGVGDAASESRRLPALPRRALARERECASAVRLPESAGSNANCPQFEIVGRRPLDQSAEAVSVTRDFQHPIESERLPGELYFVSGRARTVRRMDGRQGISVGQDRPAESRPLAKKRKLQDENAEQQNITGSTVNNRIPSLQRSRLPQPLVKKTELTTAVAKANPVGAGAVKKVAFSSVSLSTSRSKVASSMAGKGVKSQYGARQAVTVKGTERPAAKATVSNSTSAVLKKRPAWDLKGQLEDMKKRMSEYSGKLQLSEQQRKEFQESAGLHSKNLSAAISRNKELEEKLQLLEPLVQRTSLELEKYQRENAALQEMLQLRDTQLGSLTAEVEELSTVVKALKTTLSRKEEELVQKTLCVEEQQKIIANQEDKLQSMEQTLTNLELERRRLHNTVQELKGNIRVICRVRPLLELDGDNNMAHIQFSPSDENVITLLKQEARAGHNRKEDAKYNFSFDRVFQPMAKQDEVFEDISQLVQVT